MRTDTLCVVLQEINWLRRKEHYLNKQYYLSVVFRPQMIQENEYCTSLTQLCKYKCIVFACKKYAPL